MARTITLTPHPGETLRTRVTRAIEEANRIAVAQTSPTMWRPGPAVISRFRAVCTVHVECPDGRKRIATVRISTRGVTPTPQ